MDIGANNVNQDCVRQLQMATREKLRKFNCLRGREVACGEFWDAVVVTAVDERQKDAYELQIREKMDRKELPLGIQYKVFSDPPGCKIGNGGSTLHVLERLRDIYGKTLCRMKVMLIHAGGSSQRLPSASALGKIFAAVPLGEPLYQMLELKLAMYVDFPDRMKPGVLVTCADDIELYGIAGNASVALDKPGFTALAHPSPLSIGTTHGVFVLKPREDGDWSEMENRTCLRFLHKPSVDTMRDTGAVCQRRSNCFPLSDAEFVYTDSTFYVDFETSQRLLGVLKEIEPLECEIDAYGDFLQALGPDASIEYTRNTADVAKEDDGLVEIRQKIFRLLRETPLNVILLNNSKFYHIGTTTEYLFHLTADDALRNELGLLSSAFNARPKEKADAASCVMHSVLEPTCSVGAGSVVEYCRLGEGVSVGRDAVVSSCRVSPGSSVPAGVFMHSLCVTRQDRTGFVTVAFGINDDLKRCVKASASTEALTLLGVTLEACVSLWGLDRRDLRFSGDVSRCSLWTACLFPVCEDQERSFSASLNMLQAVVSRCAFTGPKDTKLISMHEALLGKNLQEMLNFRKGLYRDISQRS
ncbi:fucose-1-phosphate guanylyltransferase [Vanacampus margaritifer]